MPKPMTLFPNSGHHYAFVAVGPRHTMAALANEVRQAYPEIAQTEKLLTDLPEPAPAPLPLPGATGSVSLEPAFGRPPSTALAGQAGGTAGRSVSLKELVRQACVAGTHDWQELPGHRWIRYRWGTDTRRTVNDQDVANEVEAVGIWLAVETNLGHRDRGYVFESRGPTPEEVERFRKDRPSMLMTTGYAASDPTRLTEVPIPPIRVRLPGRLSGPGPAGTDADAELGREIELPAESVPFLHWQEAGANPIDVDLIVDFGNTRTVAVALENNDAVGGRLSTVCRPIRTVPSVTWHQPPGDVPVWDDPAAIVESWVVLHEPEHATHAPPKFGLRQYVHTTATKKSIFGQKTEDVLDTVVDRVPQMFVELSHVVMGPSARRVLSMLDSSTGAKSFLSSPKRYAWDTDQVGEMADAFWTMVCHKWHQSPAGAVSGARSAGSLQTAKLAGEVLRFIPRNGADWSLNDPPTTWKKSEQPDPHPDQASYPRSDVLTWAALSVIEQAHRQIQSGGWRQENHPEAPRRLRFILVTYPSGWTGSEIAAYAASWRRAMNIFTLAHLGNMRPVTEPGGCAPVLSMDMDEAVASQLPIVYSEIRQFHDGSNRWANLVGRPVDVSPGQSKVRAMTIDIGGGTTDISIVEYSNLNPDEGQVELEATLLFKDCSSVAGDVLVKTIIESVLLPMLGQRFHASPSDRDAFEVLFRAQAGNQAEKDDWSRITRLVLLPIVQHWLRTAATGATTNPDTGSAWTAGDLGISDEDVNRLNAKCKRLTDALLTMGEPLEVPAAGDVDRCVRDTFAALFTSLAKYVASFDADLVIVTGKPSEVPAVRRLLEDALPIAPIRILFAKDYPAGDWYPISRDGRISDAKTVTAVGAALYQAIKNNRMGTWRITRRTSAELLVHNYWGGMPKAFNPTEFAPLLLNPDEGVAKEKVVDLQVGTFIGRKLLPSAAQPEQVYQLRWRDIRRRRGDLGTGAIRLKVGLRRVRPDKPEQGEALELVSIAGEVDGRPARLDDVELKLNTLPQGEFWLDSGRFDLRWPDAGAF